MVFEFCYPALCVAGTLHGKLIEQQLSVGGGDAYHACLAAGRAALMSTGQTPDGIDQAGDDKAQPQHQLNQGAAPGDGFWFAARAAIRADQAADISDLALAAKASTKRFVN